MANVNAPVRELAPTDEYYAQIAVNSAGQNAGARSRNLRSLPSGQVAFEEETTESSVATSSPVVGEL